MDNKYISTFDNAYISTEKAANNYNEWIFLVTFTNVAFMEDALK